MFWKKETIGKIETIIAEGATVKGDISSEGTIRLDGVIEGHILEAEGVVIGKTGKVKGDLTAESVVVGGEISGNVVASNNLELLSTAKVFGDIQAQTLSIHEGAVFEGKCTMSKKETNINTEKV
ncbi:MAG: polymer-forming cytoskeletal protein [Elusimicrobiota bacterium]